MLQPPRHSQIERAPSIFDASGTVAILKDNQYLLFLFKKIERIAAALYVITGLFPDAEPLKWTLRESSISLIRSALSVKERATAQSKESISDTLIELTRLFSLIDIACVADLLSPMNFSVIKKELETVLDILEGKWHTNNLPSASPSFEESFFGISKELFMETKEGRSENAFSRRTPEFSEKDTLRSVSEFERFSRNQKDIDKGQHLVKDIVLNKKAHPHVTKAVSPRAQKPSERPISHHTKEERKKRILSILQMQKSAMIKDFSLVIVGCSEKTIQRLLGEMVQGGVLKREGDRRWSRYSISTLTGASNA